MFKKMGWNYEFFFFVWVMLRFNYDSLKVREFVVRVMNYWFEKGVDGWRFDVVYGVLLGFWREV